MSFQAENILLPLLGDSANTRSVSLRVMNDQQPTGEQLALLEARFHMHKMEVRTSLAGFLTREGKLADGSRFRFVSNSGTHVVMLWPRTPDDAVHLRLPHGFVVKTNWNKPVIYKFRPGSGTWEVATATVPQVSKDTDVGGYNQVARLAGTPAVVYPSVYDSTPLKMWDYGPHVAPVPAGAAYVIPADLEYQNDTFTVQFDPTRCHYLMDNVVKDAGGVVLYTMADPGALLAPPELPVMLPGCTDATAKLAALQFVRKALLSPTANTWIYRFCNETISRTGAKAYASTERYVTDVNLPINENDTSSDTSTLNAMGFGPPVPLFAVNFSIAGGATVFVPPFDANGDGYGGTPQTGWGYGGNRIYTDLTGTPTDTSYQRTVNKTAGATVTIDKTLALPAVDTVDHVKLLLDLHYPATMYLRGGTRTWDGPYSPAGGERGISRQHLVSKRIDVQHDVAGAPDVRLDVGWTVLHLYQGTTTAHLYGGNYVDTETDYKRGGDLPTFNYMIAGSQPTVPSPFLHTDIYNAWTAQPNLLPAWLSEWESFPVPDPARTAGANNSITNVNTTRDDALFLTGAYSLKSRHVIDYDHRSRFYAAIRVEVACSGARWDQNPSGYKGELLKTADPTYTVSIYFETNWNGTTAEQLLVTATGARPAFEFGQRIVQNVYVYPGDDTLQPLRYWLPPELGVPEEVMDNLVNTAIHQGANEHMVARMFYPTVPDGVVSEAGIEYSDVAIQSGKATATKLARFVDGQLYARTFKLSDPAFTRALWMLHALCVDAPANNSYPTDGSAAATWYYLPDMGNVVNNTTFHLEVRNGVIERWSDNIGTTPPADPTARTIQLYEV